MESLDSCFTRIAAKNRASPDSAKPREYIDSRCESMHESQFSALSSQFSEQGGKLFLTNALENECLYKFREVLRFGKKMTMIRLSPLQIPYPIYSFFPAAIWMSCFLTIFSKARLSGCQARICDFFSSSQSMTICCFTILRTICWKG